MVSRAWEMEYLYIYTYAGYSGRTFLRMKFTYRMWNNKFTLMQDVRDFKGKNDIVFVYVFDIQYFYALSNSVNVNTFVRRSTKNGKLCYEEKRLA